MSIWLGKYRRADALEFPTLSSECRELLRDRAFIHFINIIMWQVAKTGLDWNHIDLLPMRRRLGRERHLLIQFFMQVRTTRIQISKGLFNG